MLSPAARMAFITTAEVIFPSAPSSFRAPMLTPIASAMALASSGAFSRSERSSSPWSSPEARAWLSCKAADAASCVEAPDDWNALFSSSVSRIVSAALAPISCVAMVRRE
ncbi:hypothetical protein D3C71_1580200 [compost metagenome]